MKELQRKKILKSITVPLIFPALLWIIHLSAYLFDLKLSGMGILPRDGFGLLGIITAPLIHGDFSHLVSNTFPIIVLGWIIYFFYITASPSNRRCMAAEKRCWLLQARFQIYEQQ